MYLALEPTGRTGVHVWGLDGVLKGAPCIHETKGSFDLVEKKKVPFLFMAWT